jgi:hypothetical protein
MLGMFLKIFLPEKNGENVGDFDSKCYYFKQSISHKIDFQESFLNKNISVYLQTL